jgi:hypothetical protein
MSGGPLPLPPPLPPPLPLPPLMPPPLPEPDPPDGIPKPALLFVPQPNAITPTHMAPEIANSAVIRMATPISAR